MGKAEKDPTPAMPGSEARQRGRKLTLTFAGDELPVLSKIQFKFRQDTDEAFLEKDHALKGLAFGWDKVSQALSLLFLKYVIWEKAGRPDTFHFSGTSRDSLAASLADAFYKDNPFQELFLGFPAHQKPMLAIFRGDNLGGKSPKKTHRHITVSEVTLPPDCVEVIWKQHGEKPLVKIEDFQRLESQIRRAWNLPPEPTMTREGEATAPAQPPAEPKPKAKTSKPSKPTPPIEPEAAQAEEPTQRLEPQQEDLPDMPPPPSGGNRSKTPPLSATELEAEVRKQKAGKKAEPSPDAEPQKPKAEPTAAPQPEASPIPEKDYPLPPPIDPRFFTVAQTGGQWPDDAPLIELPTEDGNHAWTIKNAFEGVLILGRTGSGKTSGSGFTFAEAFLRAGFGGLVLTCKKNEAEHWRRLCAYCGREQDLIVVQRGGEWKLNVLAYEAQHPGQGAGLSENLTTFCRNLLRISSRSRGPQHHDQIWEQAGDQLLNATFDLFLLAGGGITFDRLSDFVSAAPTDNLPSTEADWLKIPVFGSVFLKAKNSISSAEDERIFRRATGYWFKIFKEYPHKMRTSVTLGIYAMLDAFRGRDVPALISSETNVTPESIMSGNIVVVDLPLKELRHTGLMVQSAWKYLFQTALERQDGANSSQRRPVFLWEDEAQYFFSDHDHHFQDTARSSRVSRVVLTQNLHSFYKEFGSEGAEITNSVFGNLNTKIFHNNSDPMTNEWAAKHFGMEIHTRYSFNSAPAPQPRDFFDSIRQSIDPPNTTSVGGQEAWEHAVRPEEFNTLRTGGPENDFMVDAWVTWMGLSAERQRHFTLMSFEQNPNL